jgi:hypothetical protein
MHSGCARAATAAEARFRISAPNALPRRIAVVALDPAARGVLREVAARGWPNATFLDAPGAAPASISRGWLQEAAGRARAIAEVLEAAEVLVLVTRAGAEADDAAVIGEAMAARGKQGAGVVLEGAEAGRAELAASLRRLRPHVGMLVVASGQDYVEAMLEALRA